jgi:pentatricopeptide repeat protein
MATSVLMSVGVEPNELIYNQIIDSHAKSGKLEEMMHWFDDMLDKGVKPSKITLTSMLAAHKKLNNRTGMYLYL